MASNEINPLRISTKDDKRAIEVEHVTHVKEQVAELEVISPEWHLVEKKLVRKLDMTLMPIIWILYLFNYLDRNNMAQAKLNTFEKDLGLVGNNFNTALSILNVGYMIMQLPSNMVLTRVRPSLYMPFWVCVWSCISASTAAASNYRELIAVRFILGISEAPFFPGAFYLLSCWYTKKELALRTAILYSGLVLATAFSGLLAAGIFSGLDKTHGIAGWRWLFIIEGTGSFLIGLLAFFILPDFPASTTGSTTWLFTAEERQVSIDRMQRDQVTDHESDHSIWYGLKLAAMDFRTWIFALILCSNHTAYGFNNFYPTIVKGFHLGSNTSTLLLTAPPYVIGAIDSFFIAFSSDRNSERGYHIAVPMGVAIVGFVISVVTLNVPARYVASFLYISGCFAANAMVYTWGSGSLSQTPEKRACAVAIINVVGQLGNIWSPYFFLPGESPRYLTAMCLMMAFSILSVIGCLFMKWVLKRDNVKLQAQFEGVSVKLYQL